MVNEVVKELMDLHDRYLACSEECRREANAFPYAADEILKLKGLYDRLAATVEHEGRYIWDWFIV